MSAAVLFQNMPPLSSEEYSSLEQSIKDYGVQVPILVDENGTVIDGHHRQKITQELGVRCPSTTVSGKTEAEKRTLALSLNLDRRHLNREQRRALVAESVKADPELTDREHARRTGSSPTTVGTVRSSLVETGEVSKLDTRTDPRGYQQPASRPQFVDTATGEIHDERIPNATAPSVTGMDGKTYSRPTPVEPSKPRPEAVTSQFTSAVVELNRVLDKFHRIQDSGNFAANKIQVAALHGNDLDRAISELQNLADSLH